MYWNPKKLLLKTRKSIIQLRIKKKKNNGNLQRREKEENEIQKREKLKWWLSYTQERIFMEIPDNKYISKQ